MGRWLGGRRKADGTRGRLGDGCCHVKPGSLALMLLLVAILFEVGGTTALRASDGFSKLLPSIGVVVGYGVSFVALAYALRLGLGLGAAYAIWSGLGTALITVVGLVAFGDRVTPLALAGIFLVIIGV